MVFVQCAPMCILCILRRNVQENDTHVDTKKEKKRDTARTEVIFRMKKNNRNKK